MTTARWQAFKESCCRTVVVVVVGRIKEGKGRRAGDERDKVQASKRARIEKTRRRDDSGCQRARSGGEERRCPQFL